MQAVNEVLSPAHAKRAQAAALQQMHPQIKEVGLRQNLLQEATRKKASTVREKKHAANRAAAEAERESAALDAFVEEAQQMEAEYESNTQVRFNRGIQSKLGAFCLHVDDASQHANAEWNMRGHTPTREHAANAQLHVRLSSHDGVFLDVLLSTAGRGAPLKPLGVLAFCKSRFPAAPCSAHSCLLQRSDPHRLLGWRLHNTGGRPSDPPSIAPGAAARRSPLACLTIGVSATAASAEVFQQADGAAAFSALNETSDTLCACNCSGRRTISGRSCRRRRRRASRLPLRTPRRSSRGGRQRSDWSPRPRRQRTRRMQRMPRRAV